MCKVDKKIRNSHGPHFNSLIYSSERRVIAMKQKVKLLSHVRLLVTPWTVAYRAPQSMEFSR